MRYYPAALALSLALAVQASVSMAQGADADPRSARLVAEGQVALAAGDEQAAINLFEAALVRDPGYAKGWKARRSIIIAWHWNATRETMPRWRARARRWCRRARRKKRN